MTAGAERLTATRTVAAAPERIFAVLADPSRHHDTEPGDWVRDAVDTAPITGAGQLFVMNMYLTEAGGDYITHNLVTVFERNRAIAWMPGVLDASGSHSPGGWSWRYDLTPTDEGTDVTLTYEWSATPQDVRDRIGAMPPFPEAYLADSLAALERSIAG